MARPLIVAIVGEKSSGKSIVFQRLGRRRGCVAFRFSDLVNELLIALGLDVRDRVNQMKMAEAMRATFGGGVLVRALMLRASSSKAHVVVLEGIRKKAELKEFRKHPRTKLIYITAPVELRWQRAKRRRNNMRLDDQFSLKQYIAVERTLPSEVEIPVVGRRADVRIDNVGTKRELFAKVDATLKQFQRT